jgi:hypothetical protein
MTDLKAEKEQTTSLDFHLFRNPLGRWVISFGAKFHHSVSDDLIHKEKDSHFVPEELHLPEHPIEVIVVRAFPIEAPEQGISILSPEGRELLWIDDLDQLSGDQRLTVLQALREREFMPEILKLEHVSSFITPSTWSVQTTRGPTELELKGEEDIRRLSSKTLIVSDKHGVQFLIKDLPKLDRHSRKLLDRFF